jgi:hypothetical protein
VLTYECNGGTAQEWTIGPDSQLQSVDSPGKCMDDKNWGDYNGAQAQLWDCAY